MFSQLVYSQSDTTKPPGPSGEEELSPEKKREIIREYNKKVEKYLQKIKEKKCFKNIKIQSGFIDYYYHLQLLELTHLKNCQCDKNDDVKAKHDPVIVCLFEDAQFRKETDELIHSPYLFLYLENRYQIQNPDQIYNFLNNLNTEFGVIK
jgi:hypothetical protein